MPLHITVPSIRPDGLQLEEKRDYQRRLWRVERWAWGVFIAIVLAAALGLTGSGGLLAHGTVELGSGTVDYPRIGRWQTGETLVIRFPRGPAERSLTLGPQFDESFKIGDVRPRPTKVEAGPDGEIMHFSLDRGGPAQVAIHVTALRTGIARYHAGIDGGAPQELVTFILP